MSFLAKLANKVLFVGLVFAVMQVALACLSSYFSDKSAQADMASLRNKTTQIHIERLNRLVIAVVMDARAIYPLEDWAAATPFALSMSRSIDDLESLAETVKSDSGEETIPQFFDVFAKISEFVEFRRQFLTICREESLPACRAVGDNEANRNNRKALNTALDHLSAAMTAYSDAAYSQATLWQGRVRLLASVAVLSQIALMAAMFWLMHVYLKRPFHAIVQSVRQLSGGDLSVSIFGERRGDEIGDIARSLVVFRDALRHAKIDHEMAEAERARIEAQRAAAQAEAEANRILNEESRLRGERDRAVAAEEAVRQERAMVSDSFGAAVARLSRKDLQFRLTAAMPHAYKALQEDYNAAISAIAAMMGDVVASARAVAHGSGEIAEASVDLSRRTAHQASSIEELTTALGEIGEKIVETANGAKSARDAVSEASQTARVGEDIAVKTTDAMKKIETSSKRIREILSIIDEIAFQTNLLALNASVEAARAGEAGLGFSVVASEVRALAQRSESAAKEIGVLIAQASNEVAEGGKLVTRSGEAFVAIQSAIFNGEGLVAKIAERAQAQAIGLREINAAIRELEAMTQQNAAMAEESTAASKALSQESTKLARLTAQFKIGAAEAGPGRDDTGRAA